MTNEQYLIVSYFVCAALSVALGALVYLFLRRPFASVVETTFGGHFASTLKRLLPFGLLLPALLGFVSVSYSSCERTTYEEIVQRRSYLVEKNQGQISSTLLSILVALFIWDVVILLLLKYARRGRKER
jgi:hypothetical protein